MTIFPGVVIGAMDFVQANLHSIGYPITRRWLD
jgi:hypothetical protein